MLHNEVKFQIALVGDAAVGKTALTACLCGKRIPSKYEATFSVDFRQYHENGYPDLELWDIGGSELYRPITSKYYLNVNAIIICYNAAQMASCNNIKTWFDNVAAHAKNGIPVFLFSISNGNIEDLDTKDLLKEKAKEFNVAGFDVSLTDRQSVLNAFSKIREELSNKLKTEPEQKLEPSAFSQIVRIHAAIHAAQRIGKKPSPYKNTFSEEEVNARAELKHTRTAKAKELHETYPAWDNPASPKYDHDIVNLIKDGCAYAYANDWNLFKKDPHQPIYNYEIKQYAKDKPNSRTAKFINALNKK